MRPTEEFCSVSDEGAKPAAKCLCSSDQNMTWSVTWLRGTSTNVFVINHVLSYLIVLRNRRDYNTVCLLVFISEQDLTNFRIKIFNTVIM
jgi:hypothetical protein